MKKMLTGIVAGVLIGMAVVGCAPSGPSSQDRVLIQQAHASMPDYFSQVSEHEGPGKGVLYIYKDTRYVDRDVYVAYAINSSSSSVSINMTVVDNANNQKAK